MQAKRKEAYTKAQHDAIRLAELAESEEQAYDPAADFEPARDHGGFVFSASELARVVDRRDRLDRAWRTQSAAACEAEDSTEEEDDDEDYSDEPQLDAA